MQKRQFLIAAGGALAAALSGCGFQLRGSQSYAFKRIHLANVGRMHSLLITELIRTLRDAPDMQVSTDAQGLKTAQVTLDILQDLREKTAVGLSVAGQVREFQLKLRVKFRLRTPAGKELIEETELTQTRQISYNENVALAKEAEEGQLYRDMQSDLIAQMLRRLSAIQTL